MKKIAMILVLIFSQSLLAANYEPFPCRTGNANTSIDLFNSDDLFFAGRFLSRNSRPKEAIECLNRAKIIAPAYIDVRLELMNAFHNFGDKISGLKEAKSLLLLELNSEYMETYQIYLNKLNRMEMVIKPIKGYEYLEMPVTDLGMAFKKIDDHPIHNERALKEAVAMKHRGEFQNALKTIKELVLPFNHHSATVYMYSGIIFAAVDDFQKAESFFIQATILALWDVDVALLLMRAIQSNGFSRIAFAFAKERAGLFNSYGCNKLAGNLSDIFVALKKEEASKDIEKFVIENMHEQRSESHVCHYLKANYL